MEHLPSTIRLVHFTLVVLTACLAGIAYRVWASQGHHRQGRSDCDQWTGLPVPPASSLVIPVWIGALEKVLGTETNGIDPCITRSVDWFDRLSFIAFIPAESIATRKHIPHPLLNKMTPCHAPEHWAIPNPTLPLVFSLVCPSGAAVQPCLPQRQELERRPGCCA